MDTAILAALITGPLAAVLGAAVTSLFSENRLRRLRLTKGRSSALTGTWRGTVLQEHIEEPVVGVPAKGDLVIKLRCGWRTVTGTAELRIVVEAKDRLIKFKWQGGLLEQRFLHMGYKNIRGEVIQFGSVVLELSPEGESLVGRYVGYGPMNRDIVSGTVNLRRVTE